MKLRVYTVDNLKKIYTKNQRIILSEYCVTQAHSWGVYVLRLDQLRCAYLDNSEVS